MTSLWHSARNFLRGLHCAPLASASLEHSAAWFARLVLVVDAGASSALAAIGARTIQVNAIDVARPITASFFGMIGGPF
jgi:hypothetical protein